jgi:hypothetical protein
MARCGAGDVTITLACLRYPLFVSRLRQSSLRTIGDTCPVSEGPAIKRGFVPGYHQ